MSKWIRFIEKAVPYESKTKQWYVYSTSNFLLGTIKWHGPWRKYCYLTSDSGTLVFDHNCLRDIADFCEEQSKLHYQLLKEKKIAAT